ncbi:Amino acid permease 6 [Linum grandiflorum]
MATISAQVRTDDDGRPQRTGTWVTASAHVITAVIGSGVLTLAWAIAQLGWVAGLIVLMAFSVVTWYTSTLLADSYRSPDTGDRNPTYMDAVRASLGGRKVQLCGIAQYCALVGTTVGYTITAAISMSNVKKANCYHVAGDDDNDKCQVSSNYTYMLIFGSIQLALSQIPEFHKLSWLSILAAVMSFTYSTVGFGLSVARVAGGRSLASTTLTGVSGVGAAQKVWRTFQAIGNIAFAYAFSTVLLEIQDTLRSGPPENKEMKKASFAGITITTILYIVCGCTGYAAFGNNVLGDYLGGFHEPFWLIDLANICIVIHLIGAYQVFCQPIYSFVEGRLRGRWPENKFIAKEHPIYNVNLFRLLWRSGYVAATVIVAMILPFFNDFMGLLGAASFWPLTVYFPVEMHIVRAQIPKFSVKWILLKLLTWTCLVVSILAAVGSFEGLVHSLRTYRPFGVN